MEKRKSIHLSNNSKLSTPNTRVSNSLEKNNLSSSSKQRLSDRFIPSSISSNLITDFNFKILKSNFNTIPNELSKLKSTTKSEINYQKIIQAEILEDSTPKFDENRGSKNVLDLYRINRKLKFQTEVKKVRKVKLNKENSNDSIKNSSIDDAEKKIKIEKPLKSFFFENISDNFYLNTLDMWDLNKLAIGKKSGIEIIDCNKYEDDKNFRRFHYDSLYEIYCVKFINSNKLMFSDSNYSIKIRDLNKELEILKFEIIQRKFLTVDSSKNNENILFLGSDNSCVDLYDLRERDKLKNLYKHDNNNEVCKIKYSCKNNILISGGNDNKLKIFDLRKDEIIKTLKHKAAIKGLSINEDENLLASGGGTFDKTIKLWNLKKHDLISENITDSQITNLEFLPNDVLIVSNGYISNNVIIFDINNGSNEPFNKDNEVDNYLFKKISIFEKHQKRILYMSKSRCNDYISTCSTDGNLRIWSTKKYLKYNTFTGESIYPALR